MAKVRDAKPKSSGGGYERVLGNTQMAELITKIQSTSITNGTELEKCILERVNLHIIKDLDTFIEDYQKRKIAAGTYVCPKKYLKESKYRNAKSEPDFVVFTVTIERARDVCSVVELKDGDSFDTKKSIAEKEILESFVYQIARDIPFPARFYICCFNQPNKQKIVEGFKNKFTTNEVLNGREFCELLGIDYDDIVDQRKLDIDDNFKYVVDQLCGIKEVRSAFFDAQRKHIIEKEFYGPEPDDEI